ncbi:MAG: 5-formyltetrahydrofolate cyclo-ligase [Gammaproteobacteria bacterium]|nr:5-formyltetrahydrofolate cyclo-ligase [Gammaproteobacteria bacterium]
MPSNDELQKQAKTQTRTQVRVQCRTKRNALSQHQQRAHSLAVARHFMRSGLLLRSGRIALYRAADGELDLSCLEKKLLRYGKKTYLPSLRKHPRRSLWFIRYTLDDHLIINRFGIKEPKRGQELPLPPWGLDLILMPLVAFDLAGNRIGMGGGYYDRTLKYLTRHRIWRQPLLAGIGHECQRVSRIKANPWDIPLDCTITEAGIYNFRGHKGLY